jgi:FKBP-type peptidyl-prolyl cis-trans isomerase 2
MAIAKEGDAVKVHYSGKLADGSIFDSSEDTQPLEFVIGEGQLIAAFEKGVIGMISGESKTIRIPMEEAYGPHRDELIFEFERERAPEGFEPEIGEPVPMSRNDGMQPVATVIGKSETAFTMDANHPLAGKDITFDITLVDII